VRHAPTERHEICADSGNSPAKSPILSPTTGAPNFTNGGSITSPQFRVARDTPRLPSIAEDENTQPLAVRRGIAPTSIDLLGRHGERPSRSQRGSAVSFNGDMMIDEVPISPPSTARALSPLPPNNRVLAGHTPLKAPPRPTSPPVDGLMLDGPEDTPTRHNTHINVLLTKSNEDEEDVPLKGPLSMPELPNQPDESNFTLEALSRRLEQVACSPEKARPAIFAQPSPGMVSPAEPVSGLVSNSGDAATGSLKSPPPSVLSPNAVASEPAEFNGVRLKKKPSTNFGVPFGQLGGFGGRKMS